MPQHTLMPVRLPGLPSLAGLRAFTLVELVIVITVLGILALMAVPRLFDTSVAQHSYQAQLISSLRHMQLRAMHDARDGFCFQVNIHTGADSQFGPATGSYLSADAASKAASCSTQIDNSDATDALATEPGEMAEAGVIIAGGDVAVLFDRLGCPISAAGPCTQSIKIDLVGRSSTRSVCIESQGFIHACD